EVMTAQTVLHVGGLHWATSEPAIEKALMNRPGVTAVEANAVSQTATVAFDPERTSVEQLAAWVRECGYHCAGESVPTHVCPPMEHPFEGRHDHEEHGHADHAHSSTHPGPHVEHQAAQRHTD